MISLVANQELHKLDSTRLQTLFHLLDINLPPNTPGFLDTDNVSHNFYDFFFDILLDKELPCAINIDWRFSPEDIFWHFEKYYADASIQYLTDEYANDEGLYNITYRHNSEEIHTTVSEDHPSQLVTELVSLLPDREVIEIDFLEDSYSWLIIPKGFDVAVFCDVTGLEYKETQEKLNVAPKFFTEGYKQIEKIFFTPTIFYVDDTKNIYHMPNQFWSGRILPGQTVREGIALELQETLQYEGRFDYQYEDFIGVDQDRKGRNVNKYHLSIFLYDRSFKSKMAGEADIHLVKLPNAATSTE